MADELDAIDLEAEERRKLKKAMQEAKLGYCKLNRMASIHGIVIQRVVEREVDNRHLKELVRSMRTRGVLRYETENALQFVIRAEHVDPSCFSPTVDADLYEQLATFKPIVEGEEDGEPKVMYELEGFHRALALEQYNVAIQTEYYEALMCRQNVTREQSEYLEKTAKHIDPTFSALFYNESE